MSKKKPLKLYVVTDSQFDWLQVEVVHADAMVPHVGWYESGLDAIAGALQAWHLAGAVIDSVNLRVGRFFSPMNCGTAEVTRIDGGKRWGVKVDPGYQAH